MGIYYYLSYQQSIPPIPIRRIVFNDDRLGGGIIRRRHEAARRLPLEEPYAHAARGARKTLVDAIEIDTLKADHVRVHIEIKRP